MRPTSVSFYLVASIPSAWRQGYRFERRCLLFHLEKPWPHFFFLPPITHIYFQLATNSGRRLSDATTANGDGPCVCVNTTIADIGFLFLLCGHLGFPAHQQQWHAWREQGLPQRTCTSPTSSTTVRNSITLLPNTIRTACTDPRRVKCGQGRKTVASPLGAGSQARRS